MTVLITGGAGYIGSHAVLAFRDAGYDVVVLDDLSTGYRPAVPSDVPFVEGDAGDTTLLHDLLRRHRVSAVVHFAGSIVVPESVANPLKYYRNNTDVSRSLIEASVAAGVEAFIFSSTAAVYGNPVVVPVPEEAPTSPVSPYGWSKLMTEQILTDTAKAHDMRFIALRYFNVAGADPQGRAGQCTPNATHLLKIASQVAVGARPEMSVFGEDYDTPDGTCVRDYIHVMDLALAHVRALEHLRRGGESLVLNCGYGHGYSVREVLRAVEDVTGEKLRVRSAPRRAGDPVSLVADARQIRTRLDWQPSYDDLGVIVKTALDWERELSKRPAAS